MASHIAEQLKMRGNDYFKRGEYENAAALYSQAIQQNPSNPLLYTNRANARLKVKLWDGVIDDCIKAVEISRDNMKAFYFLGQAQLELNHPNEALSSALTAYELCSKTSHQTTSAFAISNFVLKCKRAKFDLREKDRLRRRNELLGELEARLDADSRRELEAIAQRRTAGELGQVTADEESLEIVETARAKVEELRNAFAISNPDHLERREIPSYLIDDISFEIMHDPVVTKHGHSYERATIIEHLKRNPVDPLTREPLFPQDLRPNLALRQACNEFWENNSGWAFDW